MGVVKFFRFKKPEDPNSFDAVVPFFLKAVTALLFFSVVKLQEHTHFIDFKSFLKTEAIQ